MTVRALMYRLRAMEHCTCRIDAHCLGELKRLQYGLRVGVFDTGWSRGRLYVLRQLRVIQRCPCYFATHCIETLCETSTQLSEALRAERAARRAARTTGLQEAS
jgi:hypothetical protein